MTTRVTTARLIARIWLGTAGVMAKQFGESVYVTCAALMAMLEEPKPPRKQRAAEAPSEGTWYERMGLINRDQDARS